MKLAKRLMNTLVAFACVCLCTHTALANNLTITNETLQVGEDGYTFVKADISWDNSWKTSWTETRVTPNVTVTNWDAAWIFVKYRVATNGAPWQHASLSTNNSEHIAPSQATINVGLSTNAAGINFGTGVFLYRSAEGRGSWSNTVKLRWNYAQDGVATTARVDVSVHAIEMVYVPQGSFYVGDGTTTTIHGQFCSNTTGTVAFQITNDNYTITLGGGGADSLGNNNASGMNQADDFNDGTPQTLPASFPKGYNAFYCMKYEISEGQWVSFFNMLTDSQKTTRDITSSVNSGKNNDGEVGRNTVAWTTGDATTAAPDRACNYLSWGDGVAYADWAGLRPMTELEFEKACRGPLSSVAGEYAWGNTTISTTSAIVNDGTGADTATGGNCNYGGCVLIGPYRVGIYATAASGRTASGASYWGIMEMSGNLWELPVTVGNPNGRLFTGALGDGKLDPTTGNANADYWPGTTASGAGLRGGHFQSQLFNLHLSGRVNAVNLLSKRTSAYGFRASRQATPGGQ